MTCFDRLKITLSHGICNKHETNQNVVRDLLTLGLPIPTFITKKIA